MNESIVVNLNVGGVVRKVLVHFDKNGFAYTIDRSTGQVLLAKKFGSVTWADRVDLATGAPVVNPGMQTHEGVITPNVCPSALGAKEFPPAAYSPTTRLFYVPAINTCNNFEALRALYIAGTPFLGANIEILPGPGGFMGELVAWDAAKGAKVWSVKEPLPLYGGVLATAGNVVFYGTLDKWFRAVDACTGKVLFQKQLECGIVGNPISYLGPDGKQRVAQPVAKPVLHRRVGEVEKLGKVNDPRGVAVREAHPLFMHEHFAHPDRLLIECVIGFSSSRGIPLRSTQSGTSSNTLLNGILILEQSVAATRTSPERHRPMYARLTRSSRSRSRARPLSATEPFSTT
jgi:hypothetical protein